MRYFYKEKCYLNAHSLELYTDSLLFIIEYNIELTYFESHIPFNGG